MSQVVKCVRHTNDRRNDHTNESLPINIEHHLISAFIHVAGGQAYLPAGNIINWFEPDLRHLLVAS